MINHLAVYSGVGLSVLVPLLLLACAKSCFEHMQILMEHTMPLVQLGSNLDPSNISAKDSDLNATNQAMVGDSAFANWSTSKMYSSKGIDLTTFQ
jgi:hypothetical protein